MRGLKIEELSNVYGAGGKGKKYCGGHGGSGSKGSKSKGSKSKGSKSKGSRGGHSGSC
jgi:hypothetical protein